MFSNRTSWDATESEWAKLLRERREKRLPVFDLTASNPTQCSFDYNVEQTLRPLADAAGIRYDPDPHGMHSAREAICRYYEDHAATVSPEQIFLTTSTSEGYSFLFRLLCDPGDEVLIAQPSYPLFDFLADLDDVRLVSYPLFYDYGWHIDFGGLRQRITPRTRAIVVVNPNNPTGHFTGTGERAQLEAICQHHNLALIVDEVFLDYPIGHAANRSFAMATTFPQPSGEPIQDRNHQALTFILSGISKIVALPQMKASWIVCFGSSTHRLQAISRLEVIADTFLSMNAPVQRALSTWLEGRQGIQAQIQDRTARNLAALDSCLSRHPGMSRLTVDAGWSAVLRIPAIQADEETALFLLRTQGIAVHTGELYGFESRGWLVISLLPLESVFHETVIRMLSAISNLR